MCPEPLLFILIKQIDISYFFPSGSIHLGRELEVNGIVSFYSLSITKLVIISNQFPSRKPVTVKYLSKCYARHSFVSRTYLCCWWFLLLFRDLHHKLSSILNIFQTNPSIRRQACMLTTMLYYTDLSCETHLANSIAL